LNLGIVVLTNQQQGVAFNTITNTLKDSYLGIEDRDWLKTYAERYTKGNQQYDKEKADTYAKVEVYKKENLQN
jgi:hypothetical protein